MARKYKWTPVEESAWLLAHEDKIRGRAVQALMALRRNPDSYTEAQDVRVVHPDGRTGTIPEAQMRDALAAGFKRLFEIKNARDYATLPPGSKYQDPRGNVRTKAR
jgi:hypothetical protein